MCYEHQVLLLARWTQKVEILTKAAYHKVLGVPAWDQDALELLAGYDPAPVGSDPDERLQL